MSITIGVNQSVTDKYPDLSIAFCVVDNLSGYDDEASKAMAEQDIIDSVLTTFQTKQSLEEHSLGEAYATFYKGMGLKPKKVSTPVQQVLRIFDTKKYRSLYRIIDICMKIEYTTLVSFQVYDLDKIKGPVEYMFASGTERITTIHDEVKICKLGELILVDAEDVLHSSYYGNNKAKSISNATKRNFVRIMKIPGVSPFDFDLVIKAFSSSSGVEHYVIVNKEEPIASL